MRVQMMKPVAVAAVAIAVTIGGIGAASAATVRCVEPLEGGGGGERTRRIEISTDGDGTSRAGYMVGRFFVGFLSE